MAELFALTRKEKAALARLAEMHTEVSSNDYGFLAGDMGSGNAAACRRLEATGLVTINRIAENCFRYSLSEKGKARFNLPAQHRVVGAHPRGIRLTPQQLARFKEAFYNNQGDDADDPFERAFLTLSIDEVGTGNGYTSEDLSAAMDDALRIMCQQKVG